jgi:DNA-binding MarR family transcriptional regulator
MPNEVRPGALLIALVDEVGRLRGRFSSAFDPVRQECGCSDLEMMVLSAVAGAASPPIVPQIGRSLGHPRQVIQRIADDLERRGLIRFADNPDHKRARLLMPTETGKSLKIKADEDGLRISDKLASALDEARLAALVSGLRAVRAQIEAELRGTQQDN